MQATKPKSDMADVWRRYKKSPDRSLRNVLMEHYYPIVRYNAERIAAKLPDEVDQEDLVSAGIFGLMDAIDAFDLARGVKFETYCAPRIRGAILDELRSMDWVPRLVRSRAHMLDRVSAELRANLGRAPRDHELAERLDLSIPAFNKLSRDATAVTQISLSRTYSQTDSNKEVSEIDILVDKRGRNPLLEVQKRDLKALFTRGLSRAERLILILYYYEDMTMKEIGATLDLSESRVSQMHSSVLGMLRARYVTGRKELIL